MRRGAYSRVSKKTTDRPERTGCAVPVSSIPSAGLSSVGMRPQLLQLPLRLHPGFVRRSYLGLGAAVIFGLAAAIIYPVLESGKRAS